MSRSSKNDRGSTLLVIDTETGGTDPAVHSLLTLGAVVWSGEALADPLDLAILETPIACDPEALKINRVDLEALRRSGLRPAEAVDRLEAFVTSRFEQGEPVVLAGHNVSFDVGFLKRLYRLAGRDFSKTFSHRSFDTASVLRYLYLAGLLDQPAMSSDAAFARFNVAPPEAERHSARGDAVATARLITKLVEFLESAQPDPRRAAAGIRARSFSEGPRSIRER